MIDPIEQSGRSASTTRQVKLGKIASAEDVVSTRQRLLRECWEGKVTAAQARSCSEILSAIREDYRVTILEEKIKDAENAQTDGDRGAAKED